MTRNARNPARERQAVYRRAQDPQRTEEAERRVFILNLLDRLRTEKQPETLIDLTCEALGHRLGADLVIYADIDESDGYRILPRLWGRGTVPGQTGHRRIEDFGRPVLEHMKAGKTLVIENVHEDPRTAAQGPLATFAEVSVASLAHVPLIDGGQLRAILGVQFATPRRWPSADVKLTEEVAERLWEAVGRCRAEVKLTASLEKFRVLVESSAQATWEMDPDGESITDAASWCSYTGQTEEEARGKGWLDAIHPDDRQAVALRWPQAVRAEEPLSEEYRLRHGDEWRWSRVRAAPIRDALGRIVRWVGMNHDITARKKTEQRIEHMALYDALTGLPNRTLLQDRFREAAARTHREGDYLGLAMLDVDRFKEVNDTIGHAAGDKVLQAVAERVSGALRSTDTFARLSGDEFVAVLPNVGGVAEVERLAERVREAVRQPLTLGAQSVALSVSMGIVVFPQDGDELDLLLHGADIALYRAKAEGRGTIRFFEPGMEAEAQRLRRTEADLRTALEQGELTVVYQPQRDLSDGRVRSVEALVRWRHPTRGLLMPDAFIPVAESSGLIHQLGKWVLDEACRQVRAWRDQGLDLRVSINVSAAEARCDGVLEALDQAFAAYDLHRTDVEVELTETLLVDPTDKPMAALLAGLQTRGVRVALDDFGTGYSSLGYLKDLPIDTIKIDRTFIAGTDTRDGRILLEAMIDLGQKLGKRIIAEGVETEEQLDWLKGTGCDAVQGFRIARPLPPELIPRDAS
ncbi:PAS domain S-box-containing protein/diguanylate cyclase (GGDEF) domain-containing protein [Palleronia marisminoris]|uniref:Cyclic di-GMP phosphodiesterase Gmr n=1 Tax=Palleronia marisminoris TaxID=315423 RepID=A0A1Y5TMM0_9RHOB|nr:EAL domain-containing protein [Palleronia marisminoris]SFH39261.1 PAS domain S-box-containing protein/diguanylate cyclase (GGDEF) domain-containing protein [Palleronia marisminoris]SLN63908.1 Cyclic di-GMP phosphodiesterase Gmr [Palleronia marisminoris]